MTETSNEIAAFFFESNNRGIKNW